MLLTADVKRNFPAERATVNIISFNCNRHVNMSTAVASLALFSRRMRTSAAATTRTTEDHDQYIDDSVDKFAGKAHDVGTAAHVDSRLRVAVTTGAGV